MKPVTSVVLTGISAAQLRPLYLGDAEAVEGRPTTATERFPVLQSGEADVLIRNTTWTTSRDTSLGFDFAPVTFYDGQGMMVRKDSGITDP